MPRRLAKVAGSGCPAAARGNSALARIEISTNRARPSTTWKVQP